MLRRIRYRGLATLVFGVRRGLGGLQDRCIARYRRLIAPIFPSSVSAKFRNEGRRSGPVFGVGAYIIVLLWLPKTDIFGGDADNLASIVNQTGSGAACSHINPNVVAGLDSHCDKAVLGVVG
jgi:hypothetical protein